MPITISDLIEAKILLKSFSKNSEENNSNNAINYLKKIDSFLEKLDTASKINLVEEGVDVNNFDSYFEGLTDYYKKCQQETIQFCTELLQSIREDKNYIKTPTPKEGSYSAILLQIERDTKAVLSTSNQRMNIIKANEKKTGGVPYCYRPEISYFLKKFGVKRLYLHDKSTLGLGKWYDEDGMKMSPGATSGGLCYGTCINQFSDIKKGKSEVLPINTRIIGHQHINQAKRKKGKHFESNPISVGKESFYTIAKKIAKGIESSDIYLIHMKGKIESHAILVRKLPLNNAGFSYEFTDPNFGRLYFKTKEDFINTLPMICLSYYPLFHSVTLEKIYEPQPIAPSLVEFLQNQQNISTISLSDEWNAINELERSLDYIKDLNPGEKNIFFINAFVSNSEAFRRSKVGLTILDAIDEWDAYEQTVDTEKKKVVLSKEEKHAMEPIPHYFDTLKSLYKKYDNIRGSELAQRFEYVLKEELINLIAAENIRENLKDISYHFKEILQTSLIKISKGDPLLIKLDQLDDVFFYTENPELLQKYCNEIIGSLKNSTYAKENFVTDFIELKKEIGSSIKNYKKQKKDISSFISISDLSENIEFENYCAQIKKKTISSRPAALNFQEKKKNLRTSATNEGADQNKSIHKKLQT